MIYYTLKLPRWVVNVDVQEVAQEFRKLKWKKSAGVDQVQVKHLKYGGWNLVITRGPDIRG